MSVLKSGVLYYLRQMGGERGNIGTELRLDMRAQPRGAEPRAWGPELFREARLSLLRTRTALRILFACHAIFDQLCLYIHIIV